MAETNDGRKFLRIKGYTYEREDGTKVKVRGTIVQRRTRRLARHLDRERERSSWPGRAARTLRSP